MNVPRLDELRLELEEQLAEEPQALLDALDANRKLISDEQERLRHELMGDSSVSTVEYMNFYPDAID